MDVTLPFMTLIKDIVIFTSSTGVYIGMRATIIASKEGLIIGENTIVGAASLVNKSLPDNVKAVGVPAETILIRI